MTKAKAVAALPVSEKAEPHEWQFKARFLKQAFDWTYQLAVLRIKEAVAEIRKVSRKDPVLAAEGAVIFIERLMPTIEQVDRSSASIERAVCRAIESLVPVISAAPATEKQRDDWLERLSTASEKDAYRYLDTLLEYWGELCGSKEKASACADDMIGEVRSVWTADPKLRRYYKAAPACLSALLKAERYTELLELLKLDRHYFWRYQMYAIKALSAQGKIAEALKHAEPLLESDASSQNISKLCEEILFSHGRIDEAYEHYAMEAHQKSTHLATFRAIAKKYPMKMKEEILQNLIDSSLYEERKWFITATEIGQFDLALQLATNKAVHHKTLARAAGKYVETNPRFTLNVALTSLHSFEKILNIGDKDNDVLQAYKYILYAADRLGETEQVKALLVKKYSRGDNFIWHLLAEDLE